MFYYQMSEVPKGESGRTFPKTESGEVMKVIVSDGMGAPLTGQCVFFSKKTSPGQSDVAISTRNACEELCMGVLDIKKEGSILKAIHAYLGRVSLPALKAYSTWGELNQTEEGQMQRVKFLAKIENFVNFLESSDKNIKEVVYLSPGPSEELLEQINTPAAQKEVSGKSDQLKVIEELVANDWCKQIEQVLAESEQMRKEADDTNGFEVMRVISNMVLFKKKLMFNINFNN